MKPRPTAVRVGSVIYDVAYGELPEDTLGQCGYEQSLIEISSELSDGQARTTLWHEVLHAICQMHGPHRGEYLRLHLDLQRRNSQPIEEVYVALIEGGTLAFVRDNPEAWAWIQGGKYREPKP